MSATPEMIAKLPKWAQEHIRNLGRQREAAVSALENFTAAHDTGPVCVVQMVSDKTGGPTFHEVRFNADWLRIDHAGVHFEISLARDEIRLAYSRDKTGGGSVYMKPSSYQQLTFHAALTQ